MKRLYLLTFFCFAIKVIHAQTFLPQVVASAGGFASGSNLSVSFTVGETMVATETAGSNIYTQGFQQPTDVVSALPDIEKENEAALSVYPIPATTQLWFGYEFNQAGKVEVMLINELGQPQSYSLAEGYETGKVIHALDCSNYTTGYYFLKVVFTSLYNSPKTICKPLQIIH